MATLGSTSSTYFTPSLSTEVTTDYFLVSNGDGTYREEEIAQFATTGDLGINLGDIITGATAGSVLYVEAFGGIWEDNANLFYDDVAKSLSVGGALEAANLVLAGVGTTTRLIDIQSPSSFSAQFMRVRDDTGQERFSIQNDGGGIFNVWDGGTTTTPQAMMFRHRSTATPANGFGLDVNFELHSSTNTSRAACSYTVTWVDATDASRKARGRWFISDTSSREVMRFEGSGTAAMIGFLGKSAVARSAAYTQTYSTADRTHAARTTAALTDSSGGTPGTTIAALPTLTDSPASADALRDDLNTNVWPVLKNWIASVVDQINKGRTDTQDTAQVVNALIDDLGDTAGFGLLDD